MIGSAAYATDLYESKIEIWKYPGMAHHIYSRHEMEPVPSCSGKCGERSLFHFNLEVRSLRSVNVYSNDIETHYSPI